MGLRRIDRGLRPARHSGGDRAPVLGRGIRGWQGGEADRRRRAQGARRVALCVDILSDDPARIAANHEENRGAIELSATLGATNLAMISSGLPAGSDDLAGAHARARYAVAKLLPEARAAGVTLGLEPIHPMRVASGCI